MRAQGLDVVPGMLQRARSKAAGLPIRWIEGDARDFDLDERFRLIFLTGNAFQAFVTKRAVPRPPGAASVVRGSTSPPCATTAISPPVAPGAL